MDLSTFVSQGWARHGDDPEAVMADLPGAVELVRQKQDLPKLAALTVHVAGEHLGRWEQGVALLEQLTRLPAFEEATLEAQSVWRSLAVLHHCSGDARRREECALRGRGAPYPDASNEIRILAIATSALAGQGRTDEAIESLSKALELAAYGPGKDDPASRALAVSGNNLACALEEKTERTSAEDDLLRRAAQAARTYWEVAGSWLEVERAEYRLAMTHLALGEPAAALQHAEACLAGCESNAADPAETFFAREALALARLAGGDAEGARKERNRAEALLADIGEASLKDWCTQALAQLDERLGG